MSTLVAAQATVPQGVREHLADLRKAEAHRIAKAVKVALLGPGGRPPETRPPLSGALRSLLWETRPRVVPAHRVYAPFLTFDLPLPYRGGFPVEPSVADTLVTDLTDSSHKPLPKFAATYARALYGSGDLAVGAGIGRRVLDGDIETIWPKGSVGYFEGQSIEVASAEAFITCPVTLPGPAREDTTVDVFAHVHTNRNESFLNDSHVSEHYWLDPGTTGSAASGLVGVSGSLKLTLSGFSSRDGLGGANSHGSEDRQQFLLAVRAADDSADTFAFENAVTLRSSLRLPKGSNTFKVDVTAAATAFRGGDNDPNAGFAAIGMLDVSAPRIFPTIGHYSGFAHISRIYVLMYQPAKE